MASDKKGNDKAAPATAEAPEDAEAIPQNRKRRRIILLVSVVAMSLLGGGGAYVAIGSFGPKKPPPADKKKPVKLARKAEGPPVFQAMEPFVVNLASGEQMLQLVATFKVQDQKVADELKSNMPELRHKINLILANKTASDLATTQDREDLANLIRGEANSILGYPASAAGVTSGTKPTTRSTASSATSNNNSSKSDSKSAPAEGDDGLPVVSCFFTSLIIQ